MVLHSRLAEAIVVAPWLPAWQDMIALLRWIYLCTAAASALWLPQRKGRKAMALHCCCTDDVVVDCAEAFEVAKECGLYHLAPG